MRCVVRAWVVVAALAVAGAAHAEPAPPASTQVPERSARQGVAVLGLGDAAHDVAFALARAVYGSRLRPVALDEVRARVLAGGPVPFSASRELRELADVRASIAGDDAAGRRLLASIAQQLAVEALLVVKVDRLPAEDAGVADAGDAGNVPASSSVVEARLFLADAAEFDAARYVPDPSSTPSPAAWKSTIISVEGRFPVVTRSAAPPAATRPAPPAAPQDAGKSSPFYASGWFWGAVGGAALLGAAFYFASQDNGTDTIHLQMRVPR